MGFRSAEETRVKAVLGSSSNIQFDLLNILVSDQVQHKPGCIVTA